MIGSLIFVLIVLSLTSATVEDEQFARSARNEQAKYCSLPPFPEHGRYIVKNYPFAKPGDSYQSVMLDVTCDSGYLNNNTIKSIFCVNGEWSATMPRCVPDSLGFCELKDDISIEYRCLSVPKSLGRSQECQIFVPPGTVVRPICRSPAYFSLRVLSEMHCKDGFWDYHPICKPACGLITQHRQLEGSSKNHLELPWYAIIYKKNSEIYAPLCSGSLLTANKIISAATCFTELFDITSHLKVAVNKMYLDYNDSRDVNSQYADVVDIKIPYSYRGRATSYEDDIAIVIVERPFIFHLSVRPVCLDFDSDLDRTQLTEGNFGKVARWRFDSAQMSFILHVDDFQYRKCEVGYNMYPTQYGGYLTDDKFCSKYSVHPLQSTNIHGAGIAFLESTTQRYYLRGVGSVFILSHNNLDFYMFTSIVKHEYFIKQYL